MQIDIGLKQFATDRQAAIIDAINEHGSWRYAAKALGVHEGTINSAIRAIRKKAAIQGYAPEADMHVVVPSPFVVKGTSTLYKDGVAKLSWVRTKLDDQLKDQAIRDFVDSLTHDVKGLSPLIPPPQQCLDDLMCVYPMGDPHFGLHSWMLESGEDFDLKIAERLTFSAIDRLVSTAPKSKLAMLLNLGDMFHADNQKNLTNSGHQLDVDGRWAKVQQVGLRSTIHCIKRLLEHHEKVIFKINRGNHDGHSSYALALMISCYFDNEPRVEVDLSPSVTYYYQFGKVLIGSTHGDTIKGADMPSVMAADKPKEWGATSHRYWYVGHVHHQDSKEYRGCVVEYFRTLAARDAWHSGQGYRAGRDMRLIVLHKEHGEIERHTCDIGML
jgi:hypothetical protein